MLDPRIRDEMIFYATTGDYSNAERYEKFALDCKLDAKAIEIGRTVQYLTYQWLCPVQPVHILETASATGLTAVGVSSHLTNIGIRHVYTSLDIEHNLLRYAQARKRGHRFVQGDFERLPFADGVFDIYIMMGAAGYRVRGTFYSEVHRVLKGRGFYVMPQIGPSLAVDEAEKKTAVKAGLTILRKNNYLIAQKRE